jgi:hypothetical protein
MLSLACFVAVGLVLGLLVPLRAFVLFSFFALFAYGAFGPGFSGMGAVYDAIFAWIALQLGYFMAVRLYVAFPRLMEPARRPESRSQPKHQTPPFDSDLPRAR